MAVKTIGLGALMLAAALTLGSVAPASAEFFGCNTPRTTVRYYTNGQSPSYSTRHSRAFAHEFAAQRSRAAAYSHRTYRSQPERWR